MGSFDKLRPPGKPARDVVLAYHEASKHRPDAYAPGPTQVDWSTQPSPFRRFEGSRSLALRPAAGGLETRYSDLFRPGAVPAAALSFENVGLLLELSLAVSGWKTLGPDRWSLRCTPSSGNLHPTEGYVIAGGIAGLSDGVYHYASDTHALEARCSGTVAEPGLWVGLSSIRWREAWKYGLRAFRYCQLDIGHAAAAIGFAAAALGWSAAIVEDIRHDRLAALLGTDRAEDFGASEPEDPELLLQIQPDGAAPPFAPRLTASTFQGRASRCDPRSPRAWPQIDRISEATCAGAGAGATPLLDLPQPRREPGPSPVRAADVIRNRRSARRFTSRNPIPARQFFELLGAAMPQAAAPWGLSRHRPAIHVVAAVHKVEGIAPGLFALPRHDAALGDLRAAMSPDFAWTGLPSGPAQLPLFRLAEGDFRPVMRKLACHQGIAAEGAAALILIGEFARSVAEDPARYRALHREAGILGQSLYLAAEHAGIGASGIGCFFDDAIHDLLGLTSTAFQVLYLFGLGKAVPDPQLEPRLDHPTPDPKAD